MLIVATGKDDELHVTDAVMSWLDPSENVPVALNCCVVPETMFVLAGATAMDNSVAGVTVRVVEPDVPLNAAEIVEEPTVVEEASPLEPAALLTVATDGEDELHVTKAVRLFVLLSL